MTAPTRSRSRATSARVARQRSRAAATTGTETPRTSRTRRQSTQPHRTSAAERAYARRAQRAGSSQRTRQGARVEGGLERRRKWLPRLRGPRSRASFVVMMMGLLAAGVAATLWLSTQAIADTYRLDELNENNARLLERKEQLQQQVTRLESPAALAERAKALGMVPAVDPPWLVVGSDGAVRVVGEPKKAEAPKAAPAQPADPPPAGNGTDDTAGESEADRVAGAAGPQGESGDGER